MHIEKTGGQSIAAALGQPTVLHLTALEVRQLTSQRPDLFLFSVVRNPFDRLHSMYHFRRRTDQQGISTRGLSFEDWFVRAFLQRERSLRNPGGRAHFFGTQWAWLCDPAGRLLVEKVLRFESLAGDFSAMCRDRGLVLHLPHLNENPHPDYRSAYSGALRALVDDYFEDDLNQFGYSF